MRLPKNRGKHEFSPLSLYNTCISCPLEQESDLSAGPNSTCRCFQTSCYHAQSTSTGVFAWDKTQTEQERLQGACHPCILLMLERRIDSPFWTSSNYSSTKRHFGEMSHDTEKLCCKLWLWWLSTWHQWNFILVVPSHGFSLLWHKKDKGSKWL